MASYTSDGPDVRRFQELVTKLATVAPTPADPTLHLLITTASIVLVDGRRVESYQINVYTGEIRLSTRDDGAAKLLFDGRMRVLMNDQGGVTLPNLRDVAYTFEFYHAVPWNQHFTVKE